MTGRTSISGALPQVQWGDAIIQPIAKTPQPSAPIVEVEGTPHYTIPEYIESYNSIASIHRLIFIADRCANLRIESLKEAIRLIKSATRAVSLYTECVEKLSKAGYSEAHFDSEWINTSQSKTQVSIAELEADLKKYSNNSLRDKVIACYDKLADVDLQAGQESQAQSNLSHKWAYASSNTDSVDYIITLLSLGLWKSPYHLVSSNLDRIKRLDCTLTGQQNINVLIAEALYQFTEKNYARTATLLMEAVPSFEEERHSANNEGDVGSFALQYWPIHALSLSDIIMMIALCSLASFSRRQLRDLAGDEVFLAGAESNEVARFLVEHAVDLRYNEVTKTLDDYAVDFKLDFFLSVNVDDIYQKCQDRFYIQFLEPFSQIQIMAVSEMFNLSKDDLLKKILRLIRTKQIKMRIDVASDVLIQIPQDPGAQTYHETCKMVRTYERTVRLALLHSKIVQCKLYVQRSGQEDPEIKGQD